MDVMYIRLKRLYEEGKATETHLKNAVKKNWLTPEEYKNITGKEYEDTQGK